jgi:hypothetical protein
MGTLWTQRDKEMKKRYIVILILLFVCVTFLLILIFFSEYATDKVGYTPNEVKRLTQKAENGDGTACFCLAYYYTSDEEKSNYWIERGAINGSPDAQYSMYGILKEMPEQATEAVRWLIKAAEGRDLVAPVTLGNIYRNGELGQKVDLSRAERWYRIAAQNGLQSATGDLADILRERHNDKKGLLEAYKWATIDSSDGIKRRIIDKANTLGYDIHSLISEAETLATEERKNITFRRIPDYSQVCGEYVTSLMR